MLPARISTPGQYNIPDSAYHADPVIEPSLSASMAKILLGKSARHAWHTHPRLNPAAEQIQRTDFDIGTAAHALILNDVQGIEIIDADSYRTKAAKEARDAAYEAGKTPLRRQDYAAVKAMVDAARMQLDAHEDARDAFRPGYGIPEQTLIWQEGPVWCRCKLDWVPNTGFFFFDYKTTSGSASPVQWERGLYDRDYDIQAAFYRRGIRAVLGVADPFFMFVVQETEAPYCLSVLGLPPAAIDMADEKVSMALARWHWCLTHDKWPGYPARTAYVPPPAYQLARWEDEKAREDLAGGSEKMIRAMMDWQAPLPAKEDA